MRTKVKYCANCGRQNEDQAEFCSACGQKLPDEPSPLPVQQGATASAATQQGSLLTFEWGPGAHEHVFTDVYLKDSSGKVLLVARKPSLLHGNYTIVDGNESVTGFLKPIVHLTHSGMGLEDLNHNLQAVIQHSNIQSSTRIGPFVERSPPKYWIEDAQQHAWLPVSLFTNWALSFTGVRPDGSMIFDASITGGAGPRSGILRPSLPAALKTASGATKAISIVHS